MKCSALILLDLPERIEFPFLVTKANLEHRWNHHLLEPLRNPLPWLTIDGGASQYLEAVMRLCPPHRRYLSTPVRSLKRLKDGKVRVTSSADTSGKLYDHVIVTSSAPEALRILEQDATSDELEILSQFQTVKNEVVLHSDESVRNRLQHLIFDADWV